LSGKVAVITGASKGIGERIARGLASFGAKVVVSSRKQEAVGIVAGAMQKDGLDATGIVCHVGDETQRKNLIEQTVSQFGGIDILVNNAAINPVYCPLVEADVGLFDKIMDVTSRLLSCSPISCIPL